MWLVLSAVLGLAAVASMASGNYAAVALIPCAVLGGVIALNLAMSDGRRSALVSLGAGVLVAILAAEAVVTSTPEAAAGNLAALVCAVGISCFSGLATLLSR